MRSICIAALLVLSLPTKAALVDYGSYTTDTDTGLEWLDLNLTQGMTHAQAVAFAPEWRVATQSEVEQLFDTAFNGWYINRDDYFSDSDPQYGGVYANQAQDVAAFHELFGNYDAFYNIYSYGYFSTDDGWAYGGAYTNPPSDRTMIVLRDTTITEPLSFGNQAYGHFMVRSVVPIPAAVWLFGSALMLLGFRKRPITSWGKRPGRTIARPEH